MRRKILLTQKELGYRLKKAREANRMTQEDVARHLGISRSTIAQIEAGNRAVNSLELVKFSRLYGRDLRDFLKEEFEENPKDALTVLFRKNPEIAQSSISTPLRGYIEICRELTSLERILGLDKEQVSTPIYNFPSPKVRWDAVQQGERLAEMERRRLNLGDSPILNIVEVLEPQGIRVAEVKADPEISGIFLRDSQIGAVILINSQHPSHRKNFSITHEYCHFLLDRDIGSSISRAENQDDLQEVRANAFAAAFLMPESGIKTFLHSLGKGKASRSYHKIFNGVREVRVQKRESPWTQDLQVYDIVHIAHYFGVSYEAVLYRLLNIKIISEDKKEKLATQEKIELARSLAKTLSIEMEEEPRPNLKHQFLMLAFEAYRLNRITRAKLRELAIKARVPPDILDEVIKEIEPVEGEDEVMIPG